MKATPSDLPFMSTGFATYPVPQQFGQSFGFTSSPLIGWKDCPRRMGKARCKRFRVTKHEQEFGKTLVSTPSLEMFF
jgi:hypothetical protein